MKIQSFEDENEDDWDNTFNRRPSTRAHPDQSIIDDGRCQGWNAEVPFRVHSARE